MKKYLSSILVIPLSSIAFLAAEPASAKTDGYRNNRVSSNLSMAHSNKAEKNFSCFDARHSKLPGLYSFQQQYFIELGGGRCKETWRSNFRGELNGDLSAILASNFPVNNVYRAARIIQQKYSLPKANLLKATRVKDSYDSFKYTLVFEVKNQGIRKFRVKHKHWNADIEQIKEV